MASDWEVIPDFTTAQLIRAEHFQPIWTNLETLKNPMYAEIYMPGGNSSTWTTTSTSFAVIDGTNFSISFESFGNPVLFGVQIHCQHSAINNRGTIDIRLDGSLLGGTNGIFRHVSANGSEECNQTLLIADVTAGQHTADMMFRTDVAGTWTLWKKTHLRFWVMEF